MEPGRERKKLYYSIGEVAKMLGVTPSLLRYWEKEFDTVKPRKIGRGNRQFTEADIEKLRFLHHLIKKEGHTLEGARKIIARRTSEEKEKYRLLNTLKSARAMLAGLRDAL